MLLKKSITRLQWAQLWVLTFIHIVIDMFPGAVAPIIPAVRNHFSLSLTKSLSLITICYVSCNFFQVVLGHIRPHSRKPLLLTIGLIALPAICLIAFVPTGRFSYWILATLMAVTGFGVAVTHPESLRALHNLKRTSSVLGTAIFFNGGHIGFAIGAFSAAAAVQYLGFGGLTIMAVMVVVSLALLGMFHIRLSIEKPHKKVVSNEETHSFWMLFAMGVPIATTATVLPAMLPTAFAELGFELSFGGLPAMMTSIGIVFGSFFWAHLSKYIGQLKAVIIAEAIAAPLIIAYMMLIKTQWAVILLVPAGFCGIAGYTLIVNMARHSRNLVLGQRMGIMVGGVWGAAALALIALGPLADTFGSITVLNYAWIGYAAAAVIGIVYLLTKRKKT